MYERVLVPLDGSELAAQALPYARAIARPLGATVVLFEAVPTLATIMRDLTLGAPSDYGEAWEGNARLQPTLDQWQQLHERVRQAAMGELERRAESLRGSGLTVDVKTGEGDPAEAIAQEAGGTGQTLVVMTTHGRSGIRRWWAGSVTDKTIRTVAAPVMVIRPEEGASLESDARLDRIILPVDGSGLAEQAVPHAMALARALGAHIRVVHTVSRPFYMPAESFVVGAIPSPVADGPSVGRYMRDLVERLRAEGEGHVEGDVLEGDAAENIIELAETSPDAMVVMSTHGRSGVGRWALGSVADKVVRHSHRPVLLIRATQEVASQAT